MARRFLAAVVLVLLGAAPSLAGEPTDRLRTFFERANRLILAPPLEGGGEETRTGGEFPIEYRMVRRANDWLVRDVVVDGVSLAANYHVQFERVLQLGSYDELVDRLREKAGPVARAQATASAVRAMVAAPAPVGPPPRVVATPAAPDPPRAAAVIVAEVREPMTGVVASDAAPRGL